MSNNRLHFAVGQRWVSQTEPTLGLGIISEYSNKRVSIEFPATQTSRVYAIENAPISRIVYKATDIIKNQAEESFTVQEVVKEEHLIRYQTTDADQNTFILPEEALSFFIQITTPLERLRNGQLDRNSAFRLRVETLQHKHRLQQSSVSGLLGPRTHLLPHQIYIAHQTIQQQVSRVLLADEVGLGKTIEAGLILHAQHFNGYANRVLIIVPQSLVNQWFVEMLRKFNLHFAIFDQDRFATLSSSDNNPFESEQLVLCSLDFLTQKTATKNSDIDTLHAKLLAAEWDLIIVDEAHHLQWSEKPEDISAEYQLIEKLASVCKSIILLTATPEQAGINSHFARLRLLDPDRYSTLDVFLEQETHFSALSDEIRDIQASNLKDNEKQQQIAQLVDQKGTGRAFFRNTRQNITDFPKRLLHAHPLNGHIAPAEKIEQDPRTQWLITFAKTVKPEKILVICKTADLAIAIEQLIKQQHNISIAVFHEQLSIVARDRAAAYFSSNEEGAQLLVCSEIGSEGRNFQFAKHLILFDLPDHPDILEQRIGRLDRIGRQQSVHIQVPYIQDSDQEGLFLWYHQGLNAFEKSCSAGFSLYQTFKESLRHFLKQGRYHTQNQQNFLNEVKQQRNLSIAEIEQGRNWLLEINSCNEQIAHQLIEKIETEENSQTLAAYMTHAFDLYGIDQSYTKDHNLIIKPNPHMLTQEFPGLQPEGNTITFKRHIGVVREDIEFITWEHPMVTGFIEHVLSSEIGNAGLATLNLKKLPKGTLFLEAFFSIRCSAPKHLPVTQFLPLTPIRVLVDIQGQNITDLLPHKQLNTLCRGIKRHLHAQIIHSIREDIDTLFNFAQAEVQPIYLNTLQQATENWDNFQTLEINRLTALKKHKQQMAQTDLKAAYTRKQEGSDLITKASLNPEALRIIINS